MLFCFFVVAGLGWGDGGMAWLRWSRCEEVARINIEVVVRVYSRREERGARGMVVWS